MQNELSLDEMLHVAVDALARNQNEQALLVRKWAASVHPGSPQAHYLLGATYAQIGMAGPAIEAIERAIAIDPDLNLARFQLGLLQVGTGQAERARATWDGLDTLEAEHPLRLFKEGLTHLMADEFDLAAGRLREGIARNQENAALNRDMSGILARIEDKRSAKQEPDEAPQHLGVSAYQERVA